MADIFTVIADSTRREILQLLLDRHVAQSDADQGTSVSELVGLLEMSQPTVSKHLKVLREAELVSVREDGQRRFYSLDYGPLEQVEDWLIPFLSADFEALAAEEAEAAAAEGVDAGATGVPPSSLGHETQAKAEALGRVIADTTHQVIQVATAFRRKS